MHHQPNPLINMAITIAIVAVILLIRMRRMGRERPLKLERLWIVPAVYAAVTGFALYHAPLQGMAWVYAGLALLAGGALGWYRGKMVAIRIDPVTHALTRRHRLPPWPSSS